MWNCGKLLNFRLGEFNGGLSFLSAFPFLSRSLIEAQRPRRFSGGKVAFSVLAMFFCYNVGRRPGVRGPAQNGLL